MSTSIEPTVKIILMAVLLLAGLMYWLIPKTRVAHHFRFSEPLYVLTTIVGMICGVVGLTITFTSPETIIELHLWELILIPMVLVYAYWGIAKRSSLREGFIDEKQEHDLTKAAATTWALSVPAMTILFMVWNSVDALDAIWLPYYLFVTILIFSASTLVYFKRA